MSYIQWCRFELGLGTPVSIRSEQPLQLSTQYSVYMDRSQNRGTLIVSGQSEVAGQDSSGFSQLNLHSDSRFVIFLGKYNLFYEPA